jgi:toxin-antitoxin system PIN domain toxin
MHHGAALDWLEDQQARSVAVCRATQTTLLRLLTTMVVMGSNVCTMTEAWKIYDAMLKDNRFMFLTEPPGTEIAWRSYAGRSAVSPKLWQDAYLAAFAARAGIELVTFDQGFRQFEGLTVVVLS